TKLHPARVLNSSSRALGRSPQGDRPFLVADRAARTQPCSALGNSADIHPAFPPCPESRATVCIHVADDTSTSRAAASASSMSPKAISTSALQNPCDFAEVQWAP